MKNCKTCKKRPKCIKTCKEVEQVLSTLDHSLKSHYKVLFFDPWFLDTVPSFFHSFNMSLYHKNKNAKKIQQVFPKCFEQLTKRQRQSIILYYGMEGQDNHTQKQIAKKMKVSQTCVSIHLAKGKRKLKSLIEAYL